MSDMKVEKSSDASVGVNKSTIFVYRITHFLDLAF